MKDRTLLSWNVNGIRALEKKGFLSWFEKTQPDVLALQEIKAEEAQLGPKLKSPPGYYSYWNPADRKGYSGVAVYSKESPLKVANGFGNTRFDREGRTLILEYPDFLFFNIYFPNGKMGSERLSYKLDFYEAFYEFLRDIKKKKTLIICGDFNTAHREIDLARPKENSVVSGFLPEERYWLDRLADLGFVDTFRHFHKGPGEYSWWDYKTDARSRNVGWRIDYFLIDKKSLARLKDAFILKSVTGSDHAPVGIKVGL